MSDNRFHLTATFEVYGKTFEWAQSLNWSGECGECDGRIARWFASCYAQAYDEFHEDNYRAQAEQRKKAEEAVEREQLARLRKKYPDEPDKGER